MITFFSTHYDNNIGSNISPSNAVDGFAENRKYPAFLSYEENPDNYWIVDLEKDNDIRKVVYYNRTEHCDVATTARLQLLDSQKNVRREKELCNEDKQVIDFHDPLLCSKCSEGLAARETGRCYLHKGKDTWSCNYHIGPNEFKKHDRLYGCRTVEECSYRMCGECCLTYIHTKLLYTQTSTHTQSH